MTRRVLTTAALGIAFALVAASTVPAAAPCSHPANTASEGHPLKTAIQLSPTQGSAQRLINFGTHRKMKPRTFTVTSDKELPKELQPDQINFDAAISRTGDTLESEDFPTPTFGTPKFSEDRKSITFVACFDPDHVDAGKYVGSMTISGPGGVGAASVNLTINAKSSFWPGMLIAIVAAFGLLLVKDAARVKTDTVRWRDALGAPLQNPIWWVATVGAIAGAVIAMRTLYDTDPAWGAGGWSALASLIGAGLSAIGAQSIITGLTQQPPAPTPGPGPPGGSPPGNPAIPAPRTSLPRA